MIPDDIINKKSSAFANEVKGIFKKYGLRVQKLDEKYKKFRCPDYLVSTQNNKNSFICECKCIFSAGTIDNGKYNVSTEDINLHNRNKGLFKFDSFEHIKEKIESAEKQYCSLIDKKPEYKKLPFVIALDFDFFTDSFEYIPRDIYGLQNISAIMKIERDYEIKTKLRDLTSDKLKKIAKGEISIKLPTNSKRFMILPNKYAKIKFPYNKFFKNPIIKK